MRFFFSRVFPLSFIIIGALTLYSGTREIHRAKESVTWPVVEGRIQNSSVEYHQGNKGSGTYHAKILYTFTVAGQEHCGNKVAFGDYGTSNPSHAQNIVNQYPKDKVVSVRYLTGDPDVCVLEPGIKLQAWLWFKLGIGLLFFLFGTLVAIFLPGAMKRQEGTEQGAEGDALNRAP